MVKALKQNSIYGFIVQRPFLMGYKGVRTVYSSMIGKAVEPKIDTGVIL